MRPYAYSLILVLTVLSVEPMFRNPPSDGFPFSNYPMFSHEKPRVMWMDQAVAVRPDGRRVALAPWYVANEEVMQAAQTLAIAFARGRGPDLCAQIAARVAESSDAEVNVAPTVELVSAKFDAIGFFKGEREPLERRVRASCAVPE